MFSFGPVVNLKFNYKIREFLKIMNIVLKTSILFHKIPKLKCFIYCDLININNSVGVCYLERKSN